MTPREGLCPRSPSLARFREQAPDVFQYSGADRSSRRATSGLDPSEEG